MEGQFSDNTNKKNEAPIIYGPAGLNAIVFFNKIDIENVKPNDIINFKNIIYFPKELKNDRGSLFKLPTLSTQFRIYSIYGKYLLIVNVNPFKTL